MREPGEREEPMLSLDSPPTPRFKIVVHVRRTLEFHVSVIHIAMSLLKIGKSPI